MGGGLLLVTATLARVRLSRGSVDPHTGQSHAIMGIPCDVPDPRTVMVRSVLAILELLYRYYRAVAILLLS